MTEQHILKEGALLGLTEQQSAAVECAMERFALPAELRALVQARFVERAAFEGFDGQLDTHDEPTGWGGLLVWSQLAASDDPGAEAEAARLHALLATRFGASALAQLRTDLEGRE